MRARLLPSWSSRSALRGLLAVTLGFDPMEDRGRLLVVREQLDVATEIVGQEVIGPRVRYEHHRLVAVHAAGVMPARRDGEQVVVALHHVDGPPLGFVRRPQPDLESPLEHLVNLHLVMRVIAPRWVVVSGEESARLDGDLRVHADVPVGQWVHRGVDRNPGWVLSVGVHRDAPCVCHCSSFRERLTLQQRERESNCQSVIFVV